MKFELPYRYVFVNNPVVVKIDTEGSANFVRLRITITNSIPYPMFELSAHTVNNIAEFEISDILKPFVRKAEDNSEEDDVYISYVPLSYSVSYTTSQTYTNLYAGQALDGGISKEMLYKVNKEKTNIFERKFFNIYENFLFTTRTDGGVIRLHNEEIGYMFFYRLLSFGALFLKSNDGQEFNLYQTAINGFNFINLKKIIDNWNPGFTSFTLCNENADLIRYEIVPAKSKYKYLLKFRNSLGVPELILLTGKPSLLVEFQFENSVCQEFNKTLYDLRITRRRVPHTKKIAISSGYKQSDDLSLFIDLLSSDEIYFIDRSGIEQKCLVTTEEYGKLLQQVEPEDIMLNIEFIDTNSNFTPFNHGIEPIAVVTDNDDAAIADIANRIVTS